MTRKETQLFDDAHVVVAHEPPNLPKPYREIQWTSMMMMMMMFD
jgi:hypothetical protein